MTYWKIPSPIGYFYGSYWDGEVGLGLFRMENSTYPLKRFNTKQKWQTWDESWILMLGMMGLERFIDIWFSATSNKHRGTMGYYEDVMEIDLDMYVCMYVSMYPCVHACMYVYYILVIYLHSWWYSQQKWWYHDRDIYIYSVYHGGIYMYIYICNQSSQHEGGLKATRIYS